MTVLAGPVVLELPGYGRELATDVHVEDLYRDGHAWIVWISPTRHRSVMLTQHGCIAGALERGWAVYDTDSHGPIRFRPMTDRDSDLLPISKQRRGQTTERTEGPTPAGGAYGEVSWFDADGQPCSHEKAVTALMREYDDAGQIIAHGQATIEPQPS